MRNVIFICIILQILAASSCKKVATGSNSLVGSWELRIRIGGFGDSNQGPYFPSGNGEIYKFYDSTFQYYYQGQVAVEGKYSLERDSVVPVGQPHDVIVLKYLSEERLPYSLANDTLTIYRGTIAADGTVAAYVRK